MCLRSRHRPRRQRLNPPHPTRRLPPLPRPVRSMTGRHAPMPPSARAAFVRGKAATPSWASVPRTVGRAPRTSRSTAVATESRSRRAAVARVSGSRTAVRASSKRHTKDGHRHRPGPASAPSSLLLGYLPRPIPGRPRPTWTARRTAAFGSNCIRRSVARSSPTSGESCCCRLGSPGNATLHL